MTGRDSTTIGYGPGAAEWVLRGPLLGSDDVTLQVQTVLYQTSPTALVRTLESLARAVELTALSTGGRLRVQVALGDCSELRVLDDERFAQLRERFASLLDLRYEWFGKNLGSAAGHNALAENADVDFLLVMNPDVVLAPRCLEALFAVFENAGVGMAEAKQIPIEHLKDYDRATGETSWAATACALVPKQVFDAVGGFDSTSFFLYCDDVDFSWLIRLAGLRVIFQPSAVVFHDKRLDPSGQWVSSSAERYYSAEAALLLTHKWSRTDLTEQYLQDFLASGVPELTRAASAFADRRHRGTLVTQLDPEHEIGVFTGGYYAKMRG